MSTQKYDSIGSGYAARRRTDPRIAALIRGQLEGVGSVLNVGAGAGSYEPADLAVHAVEPSSVMIRQRPEGAAPCTRARAESLPFPDRSFDAGLAILTIHHWEDWKRGLRELRRVAARRVVLLTFDTESSEFWLTRDYVPELLDLDRGTMPSLRELEGELGAATVRPVPVPHDCEDGFLGAFWRRPEVYLDPRARASISSFSMIDASRGLERLRADLADGSWRARNAALLELAALDIGYRLLRWDLP